MQKNIILLLLLAFLFTNSYAQTTLKVGETYLFSYDDVFSFSQPPYKPGIPVLDSIADLLQQQPFLTAEIGLHSDSRGTDDYNLQLSQRRAETMVKYLIKKGISTRRLTAKGYGETKPIAPNENPDGSDNKEGRAKNRSIELKIIGDADLSNYPFDKIFAIPKLDFDSNKWEIKEHSFRVLDSIAFVIKANPACYLEIGNHAAYGYVNAYGGELTMFRVKSVVKYLCETHHINPRRIYSMAYGDSRSLSNCNVTDDCTEAQLAKDNRTELKVRGRPPNQVEVAKYTLNESQFGISYIVSGLYYKMQGGGGPTTKSLSVLDSLATMMRFNPTLNFEIGCHTDGKGSEGYNLDLSERRAKCVVRYLVASEGIDPRRLFAKGYGETKPIAPNENADGSDNEVGRAKNRRTELEVLGYQGFGGYPIGKTWELENVYYEFGRCSINEISFPELDSLARLLKANSGVIIEIGTYTDYVNPEYSIQVTYCRAKHVRDYLMTKHQISKKQLLIRSYGELMPLAPNKNADGSDNPEGRARNRRTEIKLIARPPNATEIVNSELGNSGFGASFIVDKLNFYYNMSEVYPAEHSYSILDSIALVIRSNPSLKFEIGNYVHSIGPKAYNLDLSQMMAESIVKHIVDKGVSKVQLTAKGYGAADSVGINKYIDGTNAFQGRVIRHKTELKVIGKIDWSKYKVYFPRSYDEWEVEHIYFEYQEAWLKPSSDLALDSLATVFQQNPNKKFEISVHTNKKGNDKKNQILSENRAQAFKEYLFYNYLLNYDQLFFKGYGESQPRAVSDKIKNDPMYHPNDKRVSLKYLGKLED